MDEELVENEPYEEIPLTRGLSCRVSKSDLAFVEDHKWFAMKVAGGHFYAATYIERKLVLMHRFLLEAQKGQYVDHKDRNGLNNTRENIRICTQVGNQANRKVDKRNKLGIKGVSLKRGKFAAAITPNGKQIHLGTFNTAEEASNAYMDAARKYWGDFARKA